MIDNDPEPPNPHLPQPTHPSAKAVELFRRALEIQAAEASGEWEPKGRRLEYIDIALMRELGRGFWDVSGRDVDEDQNADGPHQRGKGPRETSRRGMRPLD